MKQVIAQVWVYREIIWFGIAGPLFGASCALLAKEWGRRPVVWFVLGYFFTMLAIIVLVCLTTFDKSVNRPDK